VGNVPLVKRNFGIVTVGIILLSVLPLAIELWKARRERPAPAHNP
jgi:membrane-associated protein